jgi:hypothetical protein
VHEASHDRVGDVSDGASSGEELNAEEEFDEVDNMSTEQITLYLAREGLSPLDVQAGLSRCMKMIEEFIFTNAPSAETPWEEFEFDKI